MNVSFLFYLGTRTFVRSESIKCFVAIFKGRKAGKKTFYCKPVEVTVMTRSRVKGELELDTREVKLLRVVVEGGMRGLL